MVAVVAIVVAVASESKNCGRRCRIGFERSWRAGAGVVVIGSCVRLGVTYAKKFDADPHGPRPRLPSFGSLKRILQGQEVV